MQAVAIIDLALWDALGKSLGVPVNALLGRARERVPVIGIGGYKQRADPLEGLLEEVDAFLTAGVCGIKLKVGGRPVEADLRRVEALRDHFGDRILLACDANQAWSLEEAVRFAAGARPFRLDWLEEPLRWDDQYVGLARLREKTEIPINAGQGEISALGCRDLILNRCIDILNVDATIAGGVTEWRRAAAFAGMMDVRVGHHEEPQVAVHLLASVPHSTCVEIFPDPERDPMWHELVADKPEIREGAMIPPERPGFGLSYNREVIDRYRGAA
jgi:D-arabinonate dehydratase